MNQIVEMFQESNRRMKSIMDKAHKYSMEELAAAQREFEGQIKLLNTIVSAYGIASKNKRALPGLERMNIMDDTTAVDLGLPAPEEDKVKCPQHGMITRADCLDKSGSKEHYEDCKGCEIGISSRKKCEIISKEDAFRLGVE